MTVWSLVNSTISYVKFPKFGRPGTAFSKDGAYMAVLERQDCKDCVSVFACKTWQLLKVYALTSARTNA